MIIKILQLFEICSILICIHLLYGVKPRKKFHTILMILIDLITLDMVKYFQWNKFVSLFVHIELILYCKLEFKSGLQEIITNSMLYITIISSLQVISTAIFTFAKLDENIKILAGSVGVFVIVSLILPKLNLRRFSQYLQEKNAVLYVTLILSVSSSFLLIAKVKNTGEAQMDDFLVAAVIALWICFLAYKIQKSRVDAEHEREIFQLYKESGDQYQEVMEEIRAKQHDYKNMINAIICQHYTRGSWKELVDSQREYCEVFLDEIKEQDMVYVGDNAVSAFLFHKKELAKVRGVELVCRRNFLINEDSAIQLMKQMEILGNLIDNAVEFLENQKAEKIIIIRAIEEEVINGYEVMNPVDDKKLIDISQLLQRGYSTKGKGHGYGLSNVAELCQGIECTLQVIIREYDHRTWICFQIIRK